jgi:hypothetical protein
MSESRGAEGATAAAAGGEDEREYPLFLRVTDGNGKKDQRVKLSTIVRPFPFFLSFLFTHPLSLRCVCTGPTLRIRLLLPLLLRPPPFDVPFRPTTKTEKDVGGGGGSEESGEAEGEEWEWGGDTNDDGDGGGEGGAEGGVCAEVAEGCWAAKGEWSAEEEEVGEEKGEDCGELEGVEKPESGRSSGVAFARSKQVSFSFHPHFERRKTMRERVDMAKRSQGNGEKTSMDMMRYNNEKRVFEGKREEDSGKKGDRLGNDNTTTRRGKEKRPLPPLHCVLSTSVSPGDAVVPVPQTRVVALNCPAASSAKYCFNNSSNSG